ncbi:IS3 family transposase, partial [Listeria seeligeri]
MHSKYFFEHKGRYGARRIQITLKRTYGLSISRKRISRLLRKQGLYTRGRRRKYRKQSAAREGNPNLIKQQFHAEKPNHIWFGDISYIPTQERMLYCSVFIDCFSRKCVGFAIRPHLRDRSCHRQS